MTKQFVLTLAIALTLHACGSPNLTPGHAAAIISRTAEFNREWKLISVKSTTRGAGSIDNYTAEFRFKRLQSASKAAVNDGHAEFQYWEGGWHLQKFRWGEPPEDQVVWIQSDVPKESIYIP